MCALAALTLTGCVGSGTSVRSLVRPNLPSDLRVCFDRLVPEPPAGPLTKAQIIALVTSFKKSEASKSACGKRLIAFYDNLQL